MARVGPINTKRPKGLMVLGIISGVALAFLRRR